VLSTGQMLAFVRGDPRRSFLIATEAGVIWRMRKENPGKEFLSPGAAKNCVNMKKTRIDDLIAALEGRGGEEIALPADIVELARKPIERMLDS
jgi:quinolinate synthase